jgi:hypothetical protein
MTVAGNDDYWTARLVGNDPASPNGKDNAAWTLTGSASDGEVSGDAWRISGSGQVWAQTVGNDENDLTLMLALQHQSVPTNGEVLMVLDNGSHRAEVRAFGNDEVQLVGTTTVSSNGLDLRGREDNSVPALLRLTLASDGTARLYMREIVEDDDGQNHYLQVVGDSSVSQTAEWGNTTGTVDWFTVYYTPHGAFSPDELDMSDWVSNTLLRTGISIVDILKDSKRFFIKTHVGDGAIVYGYDLSSQAMINRIHPPSIHVVTTRVESPDFLTLAGTRTDQRYDVIIYVTTRGTDYRNAYRLGMSIMGEVFDELYSLTGRQDGVDSIIGYDTRLDSKVDDDEVVCVHALTINYMKKVRMFLREV